MSTRSNIYKVMADGSIKGIYCHWDGYFDHNGAILDESYRDPQKVDRLIALGDISTLTEEIGPSKLVKKYVEKYGVNYYKNKEYLALPEGKRDFVEWDRRQYVEADYFNEMDNPKICDDYSSLEELRKDIDQLEDFVYVMVPKEGKDVSSTNPDDWQWLTSRSVMLKKDNYNQSNFLRGVDCTYHLHTELKPLTDMLELIKWSK